MNNNEKNIQALLDAIQEAENVTAMTSKQFARLSARIFARTHEPIGISTLKRLWKYVNDQTTTRPVILDILSRYIGYRSFKDFCDIYASTDKRPSSAITFGECVYVEDMEVGDKYRLTWSPNRICDVEYQGEGLFVVKSSQLTKLIDGTTFRCQVIERGQELFLDHVFFTAEQSAPLNYICGKIGGVQYEKL